RRLDLSEEDEARTRGRGPYYPKLTAVGYGEPTFAAFYPNCYSVFGFFEKFKWDFTPKGPEFPAKIVCYARLEIEGPRVSQPQGLSAIAVGNTGTEALSACMASKLAAES